MMTTCGEFMGVKFDNTVSYGHIFTAGTILAAIIGAYWQLGIKIEHTNKRVSVNAIRITSVEQRQDRESAAVQQALKRFEDAMIRFDNRQQAYQGEIRQDLQELRDKIK